MGYANVLILPRPKVVDMEIFMPLDLLNVIVKLCPHRDSIKKNSKLLKNSGCIELYKNEVKNLNFLCHPREDISNLPKQWPKLEKIIKKYFSNKSN